METTEKIVEAYFRYVKNCFTIPNIKVGNNEIDLLAVDISDPINIRRFHVEVSVSISSNFSKLTANKFLDSLHKKPVSKPSQRRTLGFFIEKKFEKEEIVDALKKIGFENNAYQKVIVSWGWTKEAGEEAKKVGIELIDFKYILKKLKETSESSTYFVDDTLRTIQLYVKLQKEESQMDI